MKSISLRIREKEHKTAAQDLATVVALSQMLDHPTLNAQYTNLVSRGFFHRF